MSLGLFNCRLIQPAGDQLFFFATGSRLATPSLRFLLSRICWKDGAVSRARGLCAAKRTLDTVPAFHRMSLESEGKKTLRPSHIHFGFHRANTDTTPQFARWHTHPSEAALPYPQILLQNLCS
jgi:hypothetical protein